MNTNLQFYSTLFAVNLDEFVYMARLLPHSVEYVGSPPSHYPEHFPQSPAVHAVMPPMSPPQFSRCPMPGHYPQPQSLPCVPTSPVPVQAPMQPAQVAQVPHRPPNFAIMDSGSYPQSNLSTAFSPPSISWITHTQSPPLHPFPPPASPMTHFHSIQPSPPRLSHSPVLPQHGYAYHDPLYMQSANSGQSPPNPQHQAHCGAHAHQPNLHVQQQHGLHHHHHHHHHRILLSPPPGYLQQEPGLPLPHQSPPGQQILGTPHPATLPVVRDNWIRSPSPQQQHQQQFYHLPSALDRIPAMPQALPIQFIPRAPVRPIAHRVRKENTVDGHRCPQLPVSLDSRQQTKMLTVVRPTPIHTSQSPPGFYPSSSSELFFPTPIPGQLSQVSVSQQLVVQQQWINSKSQTAVPPSVDLTTSSVLTTVPQGCTTDSIVEQTRLMSIPMSSQEAKQLEDYNEFAAIFRQHRSKLGYTHADVIQQIGIRYGYSCSTDTIAQFEVVQLPLDSIRDLKSVLQMWLKDTAKAAGTSEEDMKEIIIHAATSINPKRERKRRTNVDSVVKGQLEEEFRKKRTPSQSEMQSMANRFGMEKEFIRVWFCNRRQRQKKLEKELKTRTKRTPASSPKATIPSPSYDITVMVPSIDPRDVGSPIHESYKFRKTC